MLEILGGRQECMGQGLEYIGQVFCSSLSIRNVLRSTATKGTSVMSVVLEVK